MLQTFFDDSCKYQHFVSWPQKSEFQTRHPYKGAGSTGCLAFPCFPVVVCGCLSLFPPSFPPPACVCVKPHRTEQLSLMTCFVTQNFFGRSCVHQICFHTISNLFWMITYSPDVSFHTSSDLRTNRESVPLWTWDDTSGDWI